MFRAIKTVEAFLLHVREERGDHVRRFHQSMLTRFNEAFGSSHNHQAWVGGYRDHITQMLNLADIILASMAYHRVPKLSEESAVLGIYFHDIEKMFKYSRGQWSDWSWGKEEFLRRVLPEQFSIVLTDEEIQGVLYAHGEGDEYRKDRRVMPPLAALIHAADVLSARWLFDCRIENWLVIQNGELDKAADGLN